jgi:tetratricopeptide (TPR) repeat protein
LKYRKHSSQMLVSIAAVLALAMTAGAQQQSPLERARAEAAASKLAQAEEDYRTVLQRDPGNTEALEGLAEALEAAGHWRDAMPFLSHLIEIQPNNSSRLLQLARMKSWQAETRPEALTLFTRALREDPKNEEILVSYAEVLSWSRTTRPQAQSFYEQALRQNPRNLRALDGKAQLLAWGGESDRALGLYEEVLSADPLNVDALRGKAEILNWRGRHEEARALVARARRIAPEDERTITELARADYGLHHYEEARQEMAQVGTPGPETQDLQRGISQALGTYVELGYGLRRNRQRLDYDQMEALVSTRLGASNRIGLLYQPTFFRTQQQDFHSNYFALMLDSEPSEKLTTHAEIDGEQYFGAPAQADGTFDLRYRLRPSFQFEAKAQREIVDDSLLSTRGELVGGLFLGQVRSNLGMVGGSYSNREKNYDASLSYSDGTYTGRNLNSNRRWSLDANIGKSLHSYHPYVRIAYGMTYLSFDHDMDFQPGAAPSRITGGYFSPTRYLLNSGQIFVSHNLGRRVRWDVAGTLGVQNSETTFSSFSKAQFASTFSAHLIWTVNSKNEFRTGYDFLDVYNAFHRHLFRVSWRHYF